MNHLQRLVVASPVEGCLSFLVAIVAQVLIHSNHLQAPLDIVCLHCTEKLQARSLTVRVLPCSSLFLVRIFLLDCGSAHFRICSAVLLRNDDPQFFRHFNPFFLSDFCDQRRNVGGDQVCQELSEDTHLGELLHLRPRDKHVQFGGNMLTQREQSWELRRIYLAVGLQDHLD